MSLPQKKSTADPRFPRGSALWLGTGLLFLLICGGMLVRMETKPADNASPQASLPDVAQNEASQKPLPSATEANRNREWDESSPMAHLAGALAALQAEKDSEKREEMFAALVDQVAVADIQSTLNDLQRLGQDRLVVDFSRRLLRHWAASDGHAAAAWAEQLPKGPMRKAALSDVAIEWANAGLKDAAAWAGRLPDGAEHDSASFAVANEAVRSEPVEALRIAADLPTGPRRDDLLRRGAMEWASQDGQSAANWALQIQDAPLRDKALAAVAAAWSENDPLSAAKLALGEISQGRTQSDAVIEIVQRWAQHEPESAAAWVKQFPEGNLKQTAVENLADLGIAVR
jgi:hypothetical protein